MEKQFIGVLKSLNKNEIIVMINYIKQVQNNQSLWTSQTS